MSSPLDILSANLNTIINSCVLFSNYVKQVPYAAPKWLGYEL